MKVKRMSDKFVEIKSCEYGLGVFAVCDIPAFSKIGLYAGRVLSEQDIHKKIIKYIGNNPYITWNDAYNFLSKYCLNMLRGRWE